mmetsp:Transcript_79693/g.230441  ORF Transcript_79693/g.230441 Transcript_79693/m.230441 type:complete len:300 (+) Transcript_79693:694-1593(+)
MVALHVRGEVGEDAERDHHDVQPAQRWQRGPEDESPHERDNDDRRLDNDQITAGSQLGLPQEAEDGREAEQRADDREPAHLRPIEATSEQVDPAKTVGPSPMDEERDDGGHEHGDPLGIRVDLARITHLPSGEVALLEVASHGTDRRLVLFEELASLDPFARISLRVLLPSAILQLPVLPLEVRGAGAEDFPQVPRARGVLQIAVEVCLAWRDNFGGSSRERDAEETVEGILPIAGGPPLESSGLFKRQPPRLQGAVQRLSSFGSSIAAIALDPGSRQRRLPMNMSGGLVAQALLNLRP